MTNEEIAKGICNNRSKCAEDKCANCDYWHNFTFDAEWIQKHFVSKDKVREMIRNAIGSIGCETCSNNSKECNGCQESHVDEIMKEAK